MKINEVSFGGGEKRKVDSATWLILIEVMEVTRYEVCVVFGYEH